MIGKNIPQEQEMLSKLPDELIKKGLKSPPDQSPFTQYLGAIEIGKRERMRKEGAEHPVQEGTVVDRMIGAGSSIPQPTAAPPSMTPTQALASGGIANHKDPQKVMVIRQKEADRASKMAQGAMNLPGKVLGGLPKFAQGGEVKGYATGGRVGHSLAEIRELSAIPNGGAPSYVQDPGMAMRLPGAVNDAQDLTDIPIEALANMRSGLPLPQRSEEIPLPGYAHGGVIQSFKETGVVQEEEEMTPAQWLALKRIGYIQNSGNGSQSAYIDPEINTGQRTADILTGPQLELSQAEEFQRPLPVGINSSSNNRLPISSEEIVEAGGTDNLAPRPGDERFAGLMSQETDPMALPRSGQDIIAAGGTDNMPPRKGEDPFWNPAEWMSTAKDYWFGGEDPRDDAPGEPEIADQTKGPGGSFSGGGASGEADKGESREDRANRLAKANALGQAAQAFLSKENFWTGLGDATAAGTGVMLEANTQADTFSRRDEIVDNRNAIAMTEYRQRERDLISKINSRDASAQQDLQDSTIAMIELMEVGDQFPEDAELERMAEEAGTNVMAIKFGLAGKIVQQSVQAQLGQGSPGAAGLEKTDRN
jgi:hypothetical protein